MIKLDVTYEFQHGPIDGKRVKVPREKLKPNIMIYVRHKGGVYLATRPYTGVENSIQLNWRPQRPRRAL